MLAPRLLLSAALVASLVGCGKAPGAPQLVSPGTALSSAKELSPAVKQELFRQLLAEYNSVSWTYEKEKKALLLTKLVSIGGDLAGEHLGSEYQGVSWTYEKEKKTLLLKALANTRADKAAQIILAEYQNASWTYEKEKKTALLEALEVVSSKPPQEQGRVTQGLNKGVTSSATKRRISGALQAERDQAPAELRERLDAALAAIR